MDDLYDLALLLSQANRDILASLRAAQGDSLPLHDGDQSLAPFYTLLDTVEQRDDRTAAERGLA